MSLLDAAAVRAHFPTLDRLVRGKRLVYLDSAATSLRPAEVTAAQADFERLHNGNPHRGLHTLAAEATELYEASRTAVARFLGIGQSDQVVFTRNATASLNMVARGLEHTLQPGDEVLLTAMEHHANLVPWIMLARRRGVSLRHIPVGDDGQLQLDQLDGLLTARTRIVALTHTSNVLGTVNEVARVAAAAHAVGARVVVDGAQAVGHRPLTFADLGADYLAFSAHKLYGPMGVGVLAGTAAALDALEPMEGGGEMINEVHLDRASWAELPQKLEAGTPNVTGVVGFTAALGLIEGWGLGALRAHEQELTAYALQRLAELPGLACYGPRNASQRGGLVAFHDPQVHPHDMASLLDDRGVAVRAGHHCAQPLHRQLGVVATNRASFGVYSTRDDVDALVEGIAAARSFFA